MIRATIKKIDGTYLDHGDFSDESEVLTWFQPRIDKGIYGEKEVWGTELILISEEIVGPVQKLVSEATFDKYGNEINPPIYIIEQGVLSPAVYEERQVLISESNFQIVIEDITDKIE